MEMHDLQCSWAVLGDLKYGFFVTFNHSVVLITLSNACLLRFGDFMLTTMTELITLPLAQTDGVMRKKKIGGGGVGGKE